MPVDKTLDSPVDLAKRFIRSGQPLLAVEVLEPWLEEYADDAEAWSVLAGARYKLDNLPAARDAAATAVDVDPRSARYWSNYGMVLRKLGQLYEAERAQHRALSVHAGYRRARTELRKIHEIRSGSRHDLRESDFI